MRRHRFDVPGISFWRPGSGVWSLPDGHVLAAIGATLELLHEITTAHDADPVPGPLCSLVGTDDASYLVRLRWRALSYIIFATTLEGVVREHFVRLVLPFARRFAAHPDQSSALATRALEMENLVAWRDKVIAHTAFAAPKLPGKKGANPKIHDGFPSMLTSLHLLSGGGVHEEGGEIVIGGGSVGFATWEGGRMKFHGPESIQAKPIGFRQMVNDIEAHTHSWNLMYRDAMVAILGVTDTAFTQWDPRITSIQRSP